MRKMILGTIASMLIVMASATSVFACIYFFYQPKTPKALQR